MFEKHGEVTTESQGDYEFGKKAEYYDAEGPTIADEKNKHKLIKPVKIEDAPKEKHE